MARLARLLDGVAVAVVTALDGIQHAIGWWIGSSFFALVCRCRKWQVSCGKGTGKKNSVRYRFCLVRESRFRREVAARLLTDGVRVTRGVGATWKLGSSGVLVEGCVFAYRCQVNDL